MKYPILIFISCIVLYNCNNQEKKTNETSKFSLVPTMDSLYFKLEKNEINYTFCLQYIADKDSSYLALLNDKRNSIFIYNVNEQKLVKEIKIEKEGKNGFTEFLNFQIKSRDTIVILSEPLQQVGVFNGKGELLKRISFAKDTNGNKLLPIYNGISGKTILVDDNLYFKPAYRFYESSKGFLTNENCKNTKLVVTVNLKDSNCKISTLTFPNDLIGTDLSGLSVRWEYGNDHHFIFNFGITDNLYVTTDLSSLKKLKIETNYDLELPINRSKYFNDLMRSLRYTLSKDEIWEISYDKYRNCYYILVRKRLSDLKDEKSFSINFLYPSGYIIILNKDFKHLGDVHFPENTYSLRNMFITKEGVYISEDHINNPTYSENTMRYRLFKLKEVGGI